MALKNGYMGHLIISENDSGTLLSLIKSNRITRSTYAGPNARTAINDRAIGLLWDKKHPGVIAGVGHPIGEEKRLLSLLTGKAGYSHLKYRLVGLNPVTGSRSKGLAFPQQCIAPRSKRGRPSGKYLFATMILIYYRHMPLYADAALRMSSSLIQV